MERELFALTSEFPYIRTDKQREIVVYLLNKCLEKKDLRGTGVTFSELNELFQKKGYSRMDIHKTLEELDVQLPSHWVPSDGGYVTMYFPGHGIRLIGYKFLRQHPEIKDVKE
jgi:hypothetical protein